jgi:hypothetical protein
VARPFWEEWYEIVEDSRLRQGDIVRNLVAFALPQSLQVLRKIPSPNQHLPVEGILGDWIIMSASCDVAHTSKKYPYILVGRVLEATSEKLGGAKGKKLQSVIEVIRKGWDPGKFLLAECPNVDPHFPRSFAQFRPHLTLPHEYLGRACVGKRLRLRSPFRESFGNWVGNNFSRVGIEEGAEIPAEPVSSDDVLSLVRIGDSSTGTVPIPTIRIRDCLPTWLRQLLRLQ